MIDQDTLREAVNRHQVIMESCFDEHEETGDTHLNIVNGVLDIQNEPLEQLAMEVQQASDAIGFHPPSYCSGFITGFQMGLIAGRVEHESHILAD